MGYAAVMRLPALLSLCLAVVPCAALAADAKAKPKLTFGISQPYGEELAAKAAKAIEPWAVRVLGGPVTVTVFKAPEELADALASGKVDLAWITPLAFVQAQDKNRDVTALSKAMRKSSGGLFYRAVFVVKQDSPVKALADAKGRSVAWVSKSSTSGYLFTRELLRKEGFTPDGFFSAESFAGDHPAVCKAVREGKAEVGATFAAEPKAGEAPVPTGCEDAPPLEDFRVIASTGNLPNEVVAARADFDERRAQEVLKAFGRMGEDDEGKALLKDVFRLDGWGVAVDGDFAPVQELLHPKPAPKKAPEKKPEPQKGEPKKGKK